MKRIITAALTAPLAIGLAACDVDQTKQGELPAVEVTGGEMPAVEVTGGEMPEYDVKPVEVDVKTEKKTIDVPVVDVKSPDAEGTPVTGGAE